MTIACNGFCLLCHTNKTLARDIITVGRCFHGTLLHHELRDYSLGQIAFAVFKTCAEKFTTWFFFPVIKNLLVPLQTIHHVSTHISKNSNHQRPSSVFFEKVILTVNLSFHPVEFKLVLFCLISTVHQFKMGHWRAALSPRTPSNTWEKRRQMHIN